MKFEVDGEGTAANLQTALAVARSVAFSGEIAPHLRIPQKAVAARMRALGIPEVLMGWPRAYLIKAGILPTLPT